MTHPLDEWIAKLRPVSLQGLKAFLVVDWNGFEMHFDPAKCDPEQVRLARLVLRPDKKELEEYLSDWDASDAWRAPESALLRGASTQLLERRTLFSVDFAIDGAMFTWTWDWRVETFTKDLAIFSVWDDEFVPSLLPRPLGLIPRDRLFQNAALLLRRCERIDDDRFVEGGFWDEIQPRGIGLAELYRLLIAASRRGGDSILTLSSEEIVNFRESDMK